MNYFDNNQKKLKLQNFLNMSEAKLRSALRMFEVFKDNVKVKSIKIF